MGAALALLIVGTPPALGQTALGRGDAIGGLRETARLPMVRVGRPHTYEIHVDITIQQPEADRVSDASYRLDLDCLPSAGDGGRAVRYRCGRFSILGGDGPDSHVPSLDGWSYEFAYPSADVAPGGDVFGLPNARFVGLVDSDGEVIGPQNDFLVYNAFTDYHVLCNVYAQPLLSGPGIQDLVRVGDEIVHGTSGTEAPLGNVPGLSEGSEFVHGEVRLSWKGLSRVGERPCAIVGFETTDNHYKMVLEPAPRFFVTTEGKSRHSGDIYIDLETGWVLRADMSETVISWVDVNGDVTGPSVMHRSLTLRGRPLDQTETTP
ncbi:MAG: hypothetical protein AAFR38_02900 [Planctomycetota bacterium]